MRQIATTLGKRVILNANVMDHGRFHLQIEINSIAGLSAHDFRETAQASVKRRVCEKSWLSHAMVLLDQLVVCELNDKSDRFNRL